MKKFLMYTAVLLLTAITTFACSKDKDDKDENSKVTTSVTIQLRDLLGKPIKGIRVYAYDEATWEVIGDIPLHASFQVVSDNAGNATFTNLDKGTQFTTLNNNSKTKRVSITLKKGDNKTEKLVLN